MTLPGNLAPGTYYIGAIANSNGQVSESGTHATTYDDVVSITVTAPAEPDLTAYVALSNTKVGAGGSLAVSLYDINLGDGAPGASTTTLYLSTSPTINSCDTLLTTTSVGSLTAYPVWLLRPAESFGNAAWQSHARNLYVGAIANSNGQVTESDASNNTDDVVPITVTAPPEPDLTAYDHAAAAPHLRRISRYSSAAVAGANLHAYTTWTWAPPQLAPRPPHFICPPIPPSAAATRC